MTGSLYILNEPWKHLSLELSRWMPMSFQIQCCLESSSRATKQILHFFLTGRWGKMILLCKIFHLGKIIGATLLQNCISQWPTISQAVGAALMSCMVLMMNFYLSVLISVGGALFLLPSAKLSITAYSKYNFLYFTKKVYVADARNVKFTMQKLKKRVRIGENNNNYSKA